MFVRILAVHCDQNDSYEITRNGYETRKINEIRNVKAKFWMLTKDFILAKITIDLYYSLELCDHTIRVLNCML